MIINYLRKELKHRKSVSDNVTYPNFCLEASKNDQIFNTFRSNEVYQNILEHVNKQLSKKYFQLLISKYGYNEVEIFNEIVALNNLGNPELVKVSDKIPELSGTALRYFYTGLEIKKFLDANNIVPNKIIELGCGYGGQSIFLNKILNVKEYTFVDLPEVNKLIEKFISYFDLGFTAEFKTIKKSKFTKYDLFISNYSFSELPRNLQKKAIKKIIKNSTSGFMIINSENFSNQYKFINKDEYKKLFNHYEIENEEPQTSSKNVNYVYKFINK